MLKPMTHWLILLLLCRFSAVSQQAPVPANPGDDYSGMYAFVRDGEFLQLTIEDGGKVTGFVSRYGDLESDRGAFLDQFFKQGKLEGNKLTFTTDTVHSVWYEFKGSVDRGQGKSRGEEDYYIIRGTLTENKVDDSKNASSRSRQVAFKSFPQEAQPPKTSD